MTRPSGTSKPEQRITDLEEQVSELEEQDIDLQRTSVVRLFTCRCCFLGANGREDQAEGVLRTKGQGSRR